MPMNNPSDILISTTPKGYLEIERVLDTISALHVPDARHPYIPKPTPAWLTNIADEVQETESETPFAGQEVAFRFANDARCLKRDMKIRIMDGKGVVFGWEAIDWDADDLVCDALRQAMSDSKNPMELARIADMDEFEEWHNRARREPDDLEYSVCVEPRVEVCYPPEWYRRNRPLDRPVDVTGQSHVEGTVRIPMTEMVDHDREWLEATISERLAGDAVLTNVRLSPAGTEGDDVLVHVQADVA